MAERARGLHLPLRQRLDAGAHDLGEVGAFVDHQRAQHRREARDVAADQQRHQEVDPQDDHQQRHAARDVDQRRGRPVQQAASGDRRASASSTLSGKASTMPSTDRISVQAMPPSGPLGYWPTSSSSQLSRRMSKIGRAWLYLAAATR